MENREDDFYPKTRKCNQHIEPQSHHDHIQRRQAPRTNGITTPTTASSRTPAQPLNLLGFRPKLCTKYILLALYEEVIKEPSASQFRAIVAADLPKAFDNVTDDAILRELSKNKLWNPDRRP
ncbi:hypothetical protein HPB48_020177 [Haemaphysalis longicornis]|uniref:Reverse transcriptase domain-containing protein n=1 Tax=Haemaphysalis longicornis TaxID=44386 RepID=A0A9J6FHC3_HAELO|nr:hypothetical protein HPB48_020177 [Haemaphysalis longicornis]